MDKTRKVASISDLPVEVLEIVANELSISNNPQSLDVQSHFFAGPSFVNPITGRAFRSTGAKADLLAFSQTCRNFRLAALRHMPELVRDIIITSVGELERIRDEDRLRARLSPNVHHITLDFSVPMTMTKDRLKRALLIVNLHPSLERPVFPNLEGISFSSRFVSSYMAYGNVRRNWEGVVSDNWGLTGWQAKAVGGLMNFSAVLGGSGQSFGNRIGESECLFLKWDSGKGERWLPQHELVFKTHNPPPMPIMSSPNAPMRLLITPFPPSTSDAPPLFAHPTIQLSHLLLSRLLAAPRSSTTTPLRSFSAYTERLANAYLMKEYDDAKLAIYGGGRSVFWDEQGTAVVCAILVDRLVFTAPRPDEIDTIEGMQHLRLVGGEQ